MYVVRQQCVAAVSLLPILPVKDIVEENRNNRNSFRVYKLALQRQRRDFWLGRDVRNQARWIVSHHSPKRRNESKNERMWNWV